MKELHQKHVNLKDKQIEQLVEGFQKQMQLIDVLRRQKVKKCNNFNLLLIVHIKFYRKNNLISIYYCSNKTKILAALGGSAYIAIH